MGYGFKIIIRNYFFTVASKNQKTKNQNDPTYLTKILTFDQLYLVQKRRRKGRHNYIHTTTMFLMLVLSFVCLFVCLTQIYSLKSQLWFLPLHLEQRSISATPKTNCQLLNQKVRQRISVMKTNNGVFAVWGQNMN